MAEYERRQCRRYPVAADFKAWPLTPVGEPDANRGAVFGHVRDASTSGLGVELTEELDVGTHMRCEIFSLHLGAAIPTLAQIQWTRDGTRAGVRYVL